MAQSICNGVFREATRHRHFPQECRLSIQPKRQDIASVALLRRHGNPSAITGLVMPIVIGAVQRASGRARAHVREEVFKRREPTRADRDPSSSIVCEMFVVGAETSGLHVSPGGIFRRLTSPVSLRHDRCHGLLQASTRQTATLQQRMCVNTCRITAVAGNAPEPSSVTGRTGGVSQVTTYYPPTPESPACQVSNLSHQPEHIHIILVCQPN